MLNEERKFDIEWLDELPSDLEIDSNKNDWATPFKEWILSDRKVIKLLMKNKDDKRKCYASINAFIKKHKLDYTVYCEKGKYNIYVVRA